MFGKIVKYAEAERENYRPYCDSRKPTTQDYQPGTLVPNKPIFIVQATPQEPMHSSLLCHITYSVPNVLYFFRLKC